MLKIIAILSLILFQGGHGGAGHDPHTCSGAQISDFGHPPIGQCPPGQTASATCIFQCILNYQEEMVELANISCQFRKDLRQQFEIEASLTCMEEYHLCYDKCYPDTQSCSIILQECRDDLWVTDYVPILAAFDAQMAQAQNLVGIAFTDCIQGCCN